MEETIQMSLLLKTVCTMYFVKRTFIIRTHSGEKPYNCVTCGKLVALIGTLNDHMIIIHNGDKHHNAIGQPFQIEDKAYQYNMHCTTFERIGQCHKVSFSDFIYINGDSVATW